jgi:hypothetical protein
MPDGVEYYTQDDCCCLRAYALRSLTASARTGYCLFPEVGAAEIRFLGAVKWNATERLVLFAKLTIETDNCHGVFYDESSFNGGATPVYAR